MRQLLADKISGTMVGIWLLVPEHLRLGTWDLLRGWTRRPGPAVEARLALQLVHEAALCVNGVRAGRSLSQKGFELANGLPFVASDRAIHQLLEAHTIADAQALQIALGQLRRASGHFEGRLLAVDPHHLRSHTRRQTRRHRHKERDKAIKTLQTFFCLDADTGQPLAFDIASSARTVSQATPRLLDMATAILAPKRGQCLVLADKEHCTAELFEHVAKRTDFDLLTPMSNTKLLQKQLRGIPAAEFTERWAGLATAQRPYHFAKRPDNSLHQIVQRLGEREGAYRFNAFLSTALRDELGVLIKDFPKRWHIEEFFNANQDLGWKRASTHNLHIRYGRATMALIAQAAIHQLRQRIGEPYSGWDAHHLAQSLFHGLDGDIRVGDDTILVTYYNAPNAEKLREHYEKLPEKLAKENVRPEIPWLYNYKLDFRFK